MHYRARPEPARHPRHVYSTRNVAGTVFIILDTCSAKRIPGEPMLKPIVVAPFAVSQTPRRREIGRGKARILVPHTPPGAHDHC